MSSRSPQGKRGHQSERSRRVRSLRRRLLHGKSNAGVDSPCGDMSRLSSRGNRSPRPSNDEHRGERRDRTHHRQREFVMCATFYGPRSAGAIDPM